MNALLRFEKFSISKSEEKKIKGGVDWGAVCGSVYAVWGLAQGAGDKDGASAAFQIWLNMGCHQYT